MIKRDGARRVAAAVVYDTKNNTFVVTYALYNARGKRFFISFSAAETREKIYFPRPRAAVTVLFQPAV